MPIKIISVVGARPNFMKVAPLHRVFTKTKEIDSIIVHTGQHYDHAMSQVFFDQLGLPRPHHYLGVEGGSHAQQTARVMMAFDEIIDDAQPDLVLVVGDVNSTLACALTAVKKHIRVAHVEAGLRSGDRSMPEEINRVITDAISDLLFVSEPSGIDHLVNEGISKTKIHFVGNVMIDSLCHFLPEASKLDLRDILADSRINTLDSESGQIWDFTSPFVLMTMHRPSNVDSAENLHRVVDIAQQLAQRASVIFAIHPRTKKKMESLGGLDILRCTPHMHLTGPLGYLQFVKLMKEAALVITDSGGVQEETCFLRTPCITFRSSTERPSTIESGSNTLMASLDVAATVQLAEEKLSMDGSHATDIPALWDGKTADRIRDVLMERLSTAWA